MWKRLILVLLRLKCIHHAVYVTNKKYYYFPNIFAGKYIYIYLYVYIINPILLMASLVRKIHSVYDSIRIKIIYEILNSIHPFPSVFRPIFLSVYKNAKMYTLSVSCEYIYLSISIFN